MLLLKNIGSNLLLPDGSSAMWTYSLDDKLGFFDQVAFGNRNLRNGYILETDGLVTHCTGQVDMMTIVVRTMANAILLHAGTIVNRMQDVMFGKEHKSSIDRGAVSMC